jgi:orotidine-5'-phosphate decarboxylase
MAHPKNRIIFPLDVPDLNKALELVEILKDDVGVFKIGLELFVRSGPRAVEAVKERSSAAIFLDMKFHDIPETVKGAIRSASALGVEFVTVHTEGGSSLIKAVVEGSGGKTKVLGVTVLTSLSKDDLIEAGFDPKFKDASALVAARARLAKSAGCAGIVCSGLEAGLVKKELGKDFLVITPGIRPKDSPPDDQKRLSTPYEAIYNGADYIVVGRPIRNAQDPRKAASLIAEELGRALKDRA